MASVDAGTKPTTADRIRALRLWGHREWDALYDRLCHPSFTGTIIIELSSKDGRPGEPQVTTRKYGTGSEL